MNRDGLKTPVVYQQTDVKNEGIFDFWNGDKYEGEFTAQRHPSLITRDGKGTYFTNDDCMYKGVWKKDFLEEAYEITFKDKSKFTGTLENMQLEGPGTYKFREGVEISGYLLNNTFVGDIELKDPNAHYWTGRTSYSESEIFFLPVQPFWESVLDTQQLIPSFAEGEGREFPSQ